MIAFIGCGNMGHAIMKGILSKGLYTNRDIIGVDKNEECLEKIKEELGIEVTTDNKSAARKADVIVMAVKPLHYETAVKEIRDVVEDQLIISIAAGQTMERIEGMFGKKIHLVRTMPNTPALVLEGATGMCVNPWVTEDEKKKAKDIFESFGVCKEVGEYLMDTVVGVSGSSPAYVFLFIEAMADAAVADGMPRKDAYDLAAQSVLGSAKMVLETGLHPGVLKDMVCSPGGTTMEAVRVLEEKGFRSAVIEAQKACVKKSKEL